MIAARYRYEPRPRYRSRKQPPFVEWDDDVALAMQNGRRDLHARQDVADVEMSEGLHEAPRILR